MSSEIIENKLFYEKEILKIIISDWSAYYTVLLLKQYYYNNSV